MNKASKEENEFSLLIQKSGLIHPDQYFIPQESSNLTVGLKDFKLTSIESFSSLCIIIGILFVSVFPLNNVFLIIIAIIIIYCSKIMYTGYLRYKNINTTNKFYFMLSSFLKLNTRYDSLLQKAIRLIQEVELVSYGYRM